MKVKKKLKLRSWVKTTIAITVLLVIVVMFINIASSRVEKIDNGELIVVSENQMTERN